MNALTPGTPEELAAALAGAASRKQSIELGGRFTKARMGGFLAAADVRLSTACLNRVLEYEPKDLTISVQAGLPWRELVGTLAAERQMLPLDPIFPGGATVGGVIAANCSGPRRRLYGTARDMVIGMRFATTSGKLVQSGGMVVKNVAGLDMAKLMIGSMGTLAAITVVNFKVFPAPAAERSYLLAYDDLAAAIQARDALLRGVLQPAAVDLINPAAASILSRSGYLLAISAGGKAALLERYERELDRLGALSVLSGPEHDAFWGKVANFAGEFVEKNLAGAVARVSSTLQGIQEVLASLEVPAIARAGSGVVYACFPGLDGARNWLEQVAAKSWKAIMEFAPEDRQWLEMWPRPGGDFGVFEQIKQQFDPERVLNRGRLYNRI